MLKELQHENDPKYVRASRISYGCEAADVMIKSMDVHVPMNLLTIFMIGEGTHKEIQRAYKPEQVEVKLIVEQDGFTIGGHIDLFVKGDIIDIKTCSTFAGLPKPYHKTQVSIYKLLAEKCNLQTGKMKIQAVNKATGERRWYEIDKTTITWDEIINYAKNVTSYLSGKNVKLKFNRGSSACRICWVESYCDMFYKINNQNT